MKKETPEQAEKRRANERKELRRLETLQQTPVKPHYLLVLMIVLTVIYIVDEISSSMNSAMQPYVLIDLFKVPNGDILSDEYSQAVASATVLSIPTYMIMLFTPFYKALADRLGRRIFLVINTTLMGAGLLVCMIAPNFYVYMIGVLMVTFVQSNDMQVMYIMETAPAKHRAKLCSVTKAIALAGVSLIGVSRSLFYDPQVVTSWRLVFLIPAILGLAVGVGCIPFVKETPVFLQRRIAWLRSSEEERAAEETSAKEAEKKKSSGNGGVIPAFRYIFTNKQMRSITFASLVFCVATGVTNYYSTILEAANGTGAITADQITTIVILYPFVNAIVTFLSGFFSDGLGRKRASLVLSGIAAVGITMFILGCRYGWGIYPIAVGYGMFIGGLWSVTDTLCLVMSGESTPTNLRASVMGAMSFISAMGMIAAIAVIVIGMNIVGSGDVGMVCLAITLPFMLIAMVMLMKNVKETVSTDLNTVGEEN